ncbi:response regulator [Nocardia acidivorans]|uniref:response regulator n=1 Tax=Nocardia acidivorans TaxID=404580 RepID=UPI000829CB51|nr:response regulator transcription factor [Nocardia acidivorans]
MIRIFIADNNIARFGLKSLFENTPSLTVVGGASAAAQALESMDPRSVDIAIVGLNLPDGSGIDLCRRIQMISPGIKCVIFTEAADPETMAQAALAGAAGCLTKNLPGEVITQAIRSVAAGKLAFDQRVTEVLIRHVRQSTTVCKALRELTTRELALFDLVSTGHSSQQIANSLGIAEKTVRNNLTKLYAKLGVENRNQLTELSTQLRNGLLPVRLHDRPQSKSSAA